MKKWDRLKERFSGAEQNHFYRRFQRERKKFSKWKQRKNRLRKWNWYLFQFASLFTSLSIPNPSRLVTEKKPQTTGESGRLLYFISFSVAFSTAISKHSWSVCITHPKYRVAKSLCFTSYLWLTCLTFSVLFPSIHTCESESWGRKESLKS